LIEIDPTTDAADRDGMRATRREHITQAVELAYVVARIAQGPLIAQHGGANSARRVIIQSEIQSERRAACIDNAFDGRLQIPVCPVK